jgi:PAS domain S-box-containing protein
MSEVSTVLSQIDPKGYFVGLAKASSDIIILVDPNNFTLQYINHIKPGFTLDELIGAEVFNFVYPEHIESYRRILKEVVTTKEKRELELETEDRIDDLGKAWYFCSISPLVNGDDPIESIIIISKDITSSKRQEIEIHNRKEKLFAIINNTKDMIMSIDLNLNITEYNTVLGKLVERGYGKINLIGTCVLDYIDPKKENLLRGIYDKVFNGEIVNNIERFETQVGKAVYNETNYHPIYNFQQEVTGISIFSKDITERILNEQKLINTLKEREVLLSEIHHRIKNNLALVSSMLQLKEMNLENEVAKEALSDSRKRIKSTALVHEMLYRNDNFDNIKLNDYVVELFNNLNTDKNIQLDFDGENHVLGVNKALPFGLMLHELMMNSFKHSFKRNEISKLKIRSRINNEFLNIKYYDYSGIFPDNISFNDTTTTGLMLIHTFIEQLNGSIKLISKEPPEYDINIPID